MTKLKINTYAVRIPIKSLRDITKSEFVKICNELQENFNEHYKTDEYSFKPEQISEGGILFENFSSLGYGDYKTMRLYFIDGRCGNESLYGFIPYKVKELWQDDNDVLIPKGRQLFGLLKSFEGAPVWTVKELEIFKKCFNNYGLNMYRRLPSQKSLRYQDPK